MKDAAKPNMHSQRSAATCRATGATLPSLTSATRAFCAMCLIYLALPCAPLAQLAPGPYEILPFDDGCIIEAFRDMDLRSTYFADWTGWTTNYSGWLLISPHCYDGHSGTDFSV